MGLCLFMNDVTQIWTFSDPPPPLLHQNGKLITSVYLVSQKYQPPARGT